MLRCFLLLLAALSALCCVFVSLLAQTPVLDSLRRTLAATSTDTTKISLRVSPVWHIERATVRTTL